MKKRNLDFDFFVWLLVIFARRKLIFARPKRQPESTVYKDEH